MKHPILFLLFINFSLFTLPAAAGAPAKQTGGTERSEIDSRKAAPKGGDRPGASTQAPHQNFIIIFTDDQGYQDLGCFGSKEIKTPHIDRMASEGRMLTSFYSANPVCSASRAALMTGCYPRRVLSKIVLFPGSDIGLHPGETTIADALKSAGYATACVGKWHLGHHPEFLPTRQGFDSYFGIPYSNDMSHPATAKRPRYGNWDEYWSKKDESGIWQTPLIENEKIIEHPVDQRTITRRYTDRAIDFITENKNKPFFLYLAHSMPHVPLYLP
ncbi:MAG: sulfatase-like hydrolase/transferase, partial [Akkermansiaceae bacterium]